jgi:hypothetical protein
LQIIKTNPKITCLLANIIINNKDRWSSIYPSNSSIAEFNEQIIPEKEILKTKDSSIDAFVSMELPAIKTVVDLLGAKSCTNAIIYSSNSIMPWHTNSDMPGLRVYYVYTAAPSIFRYKEGGVVTDSIDAIGWNARAFLVPTKGEPLWHTIWSPSVRFSFGFNFC